MMSNSHCPIGGYIVRSGVETSIFSRMPRGVESCGAIQGECPHLADSVAKVRGRRLARNNRIVAKEFLNRCCALVAVLESMLPAQAPKIVLQQYLPGADVGYSGRPVLVGAPDSVVEFTP
jgi:hypothetical protein